MAKKIKSISAIRTDYMPGEEDDDEEIQVSEFKTALEEFDDNSNLIKEITFDENEAIEQVYQYKYNEKGKLIEEALYYDSEEVVNRKSFEYNEKENLEKEIIFYSEEEIDTIAFRYNEAEKLIEKTTINSNNEVETTEKFVYLNNNLIENSI